ncbi:MAG: hypothetical protein K0S79_123 [Nitrospira sp.]|jgi:hypothetical protein|nr:hypothetical protein [Nitrospira sp.]
MPENEEEKPAFLGAWVQAWVFVHSYDFDHEPTDEELREKARAMYAVGSDNDIEIDEDCKFSRLDE